MMRYITVTAAALVLLAACLYSTSGMARAAKPPDAKAFAATAQRLTDQLRDAMARIDRGSVGIPGGLRAMPHRVWSLTGFEIQHTDGMIHPYVGTIRIQSKTELSYGAVLDNNWTFTLGYEADSAKWIVQQVTCAKDDGSVEELTTMPYLREAVDAAQR